MRAVLSLVFLATLGLAGSYRLPEDVVPVHYDLELVTNLGDENDKYEFSGTVRIKVKCVQPTGNITLHAKNLHIDKSNVTLKSNGTDLKVQKVDCDSPNEFLVINLDDGLQKDVIYDLAISFRGELKDALAGYYRSSYIANNKTHYIATTQFESTDARRAFPCFDEPGMKATFAITMGHNKKYTAISNMPQIKIEDMKNKENFIWTHFDKTVPMSTYLVAFIVSDFSSETAPSTKDSNVTFRIWSRKEAINQTHFAKDIGPKFLSYYEDFFGIKYPLPKQDMIAIPDFSAGAMENWGLVTYRESALLYDPQHSTSVNQESIASVVAHELAHQWFGNLVTMKWWTDLWLNEGFATYMAALAVHHTFPHWNSLVEESAMNFMSVLGFDSLKSSHPISVTIGHPSEIDQIFDTISYNKGSTILRMMSMFLSEETLRTGVSNYLYKHKYKNAEQDDLWDSLTEQAHKDKKLPESLTVKKVMDTWTLQTGYPVVNVDREYGKDGKGSVTVTQKRFLLDTSEKPDKQCWWVPLSYTDKTESDFKTTAPKHWLPCKNEPETLEIATKDDEWLLFNIQAGSLVRVNYDIKNWKMLVDVLNSTEYEKIPVINRVQLLSDSAYLAWAGELPYKIFFGMFKYLARDSNYASWDSGLSALSRVGKIIRRTESYGLFKKYVKCVFTPIYEKLNGLEITEETKKSLNAIKHQVQVISISCKYNAGSCIADANKKFADFKKDPIQNDLQKDIKYSIICSALRQGSEEDWEFMWQQYLKSNVATEKSSILYNLGCTQHIWLLRRYLQRTLDPNSGIRKQDYNTVFNSVAKTEIGFFIGQNFLEENIQKIHDSLAPNFKRLGRYLSTLAVQMTTETEYNWFRNFTTNNAELLKDSKQLVAQSMEKIKLNLQWQERHGANIKKFFE